MSDVTGKLGPVGLKVEERPIVSPVHRGLPRPFSAHRLSPLDMSMPRLYGSRWILCFPIPPSSDKSTIYDTLKIGLAQTISEIPWIAGNVGPEEGHDPLKNRIQVLDGPGGIEFGYKDLTDTLPSYTDLENERFPLSKLTTADLSPVEFVPQAPHAVMAAQANFIGGGLLLTIAVHHSVCDASGVGSILETWAQNTAVASGSGSFIVHDPSDDDRGLLMEGKPGAKLVDFPEYVLMPTAPHASSDTNGHQMASAAFRMPAMTSHVFHFSPDSLATLKSAAAAYSTNDALSGFLWRHMTLARNTQSLLTPITATAGPEVKTCALIYSADIRSRTIPPLPRTFYGNASVAVLTKRVPMAKLTADSGLTTAAAAVRISLRTLSIPDRIPLTLGLFASQPDPTMVKYAFRPGSDVSATSWADVPIYRLDWGVLGPVQAFRIPGEGADGVTAVFPRLRDGGLEVMVGLEDGAMGKLLRDVEFKRFATLWA